eukprot:1909461-Rhodomonas_salina.2
MGIESIEAGMEKRAEAKREAVVGGGCGAEMGQRTDGGRQGAEGQEGGRGAGGDQGQCTISHGLRETDKCSGVRSVPV